MGTSKYFILYFENSQQSQEDICDEISMDLPERFKKSKLIFEPIYQKHGFHECILTLEYLQDKILREYNDEIVLKNKLFQYSKKAYIKIRNNGECICNEKNKNKQKTKGLENELEKGNNEDKQKIKELEYELEKEKRKRQEIENSMMQKEIYYKLGKMEKDIEQLKIYKSFNENEMKSKESNDTSKSNSSCPPFAFSNSSIKTNCFLIECNKEYEELITKYENEEIFPYIQTFINNTYSNFLKDLRYRDFQHRIFNILDFDSMYFSIKKKLEDNLLKICENIKKIEHFNIVLLGREGVGKSTLLNSVLKLNGEHMAKTGEGGSVTLEIKRYSNLDPKMDFLRLYDTQGIGIKEENSIEKVFSDISKLINKQIFKDNPNPDDLIHCLWFCYDGRFGDLENELLKKLSETYSDKTLPFIIVHTQTFSRAKANKSIEKIMKDYEIPQEKFCQVLARDEDEDEDGQYDEPKRKSFGIEELMKKTALKIEDAVESANYQFTKYHIFIEIDKYLDDISKAVEIEYNDNYKDFKELKKELFSVLYNKAKLLIENITLKDFDRSTALKSGFDLFLSDTILKAESLFNLMIDEIIKMQSPQIGKILFEKEKNTPKDEENDFKNEKYFMYEYQDDIKNPRYPFRKKIEKEVQTYIFFELVNRVMEYFRLAIKQSFTDYAREKDKEIMDLYKKFSEESIKCASKEIVKKIELSFHS